MASVSEGVAKLPFGIAFQDLAGAFGVWFVPVSPTKSPHDICASDFARVIVEPANAEVFVVSPGLVRVSGVGKWSQVDNAMQLVDSPGNMHSSLMPSPCCGALHACLPKQTAPTVARSDSRGIVATILSLSGHNKPPVYKAGGLLLGGWNEKVSSITILRCPFTVVNCRWQSGILPAGRVQVCMECINVHP